MSSKPLEDLMTRKHSFSAKIVELISVASRRLRASCCVASSRRSLPAQSTSVSEPPPQSSRKTAWDREEVL